MNQLVKFFGYTYYNNDAGIGLHKTMYNTKSNIIYWIAYPYNPGIAYNVYPKGNK